MPAQAELELEGVAAAPVIVHCRQDVRRVVRVQAVGPGLAELVADGPPGQVGPTLVEVGELPQRVGVPDQDRDGVHQLAEALILVHQAIGSGK